MTNELLSHNSHLILCSYVSEKYLSDQASIVGVHEKYFN